MEVSPATNGSGGSRIRVGDVIEIWTYKGLAYRPVKQLLEKGIVRAPGKEGWGTQSGPR